MKNKVKNDKLGFALKLFICLIITPLIAFFVLTPLFIVWANKNAKLVGLWITRKSDFMNDLNSFYYRNDKYSVFCVLAIVASVFIMFMFLNWRWLLSKSAKFFINGKDNKESWEYNVLTHEGLSRRRFLKKFRSDVSGWTFGYLGSKDGYVVPTKKDLHSCVIGISGSGKSEKVIIPNICRNALLKDSEKPNFIITDPKGEILQKTGRFLQDNGYTVKVFDFENYQVSVKWNPLKMIWDAFHSKSEKELTKNDYSVGYQLIYELVNSFKWADNQKDSIWVSNAKNIVICIIKFLVLYSLINGDFTLEFFNMSNVVKYLNIDTLTKSKWVSILNKNKNRDEYWNKLYADISGFISTAEDTLSGYLSNAMSALMQFSADVGVEEITSNHNLDMNALFDDEKPFVVFVKFPDHKKSSQFLISIVISQIYKIAVDKANTDAHKKLKRKLLFMLEEFNSIERLNDFENWLSISRSRQIFFLVVLQDYEQLQKYNSGKNEHIQIKSQFGLTWFLETANEDTLESFSKMLGEKEVEKVSTSTNSSGGNSKSTSMQRERIMSVADIKYKSPDTSIILCSKVKPILMRPVPAWKYFDYDYYENDEFTESEKAKVYWDFEKMKLKTFKGVGVENDNDDNDEKENDDDDKENKDNGKNDRKELDKEKDYSSILERLKRDEKDLSI
ncbi:type IV secretory system conjugative DNA transfer family protein [Mycoplasmopsis primatum]|uniref:type IV secretory system conjugative DNA transfer family protein n=1 Tax=Mycoplasmopsis primatum TaxID=55604 RepID=UPI000690EDBC|nr:type IV secretory system conjugative DNA transfer family protein [Mycoplasmopsis primatum]